MTETLLQINTTCNYAATGKIAEEIGLLAKGLGWKSYIAHGSRYRNPSKLESFQVGDPFDERCHGALWSRMLDRHGLGSGQATKRLIGWIETISPDVVHLHNLHGYYLNYEILFKYLQKSRCRVVWTLHDCWAMTGHCTNFSAIGCEKWKAQCGCCPQKKEYPSSWFIDNSVRNFEKKKRLFTSLGDRLVLVPVSEWTAANYRQSFFKDTRIEVIHNGINTQVFIPTMDKTVRKRLGLSAPHLVLGVANGWGEKKGLYDFYKLREMLPRELYDVLLVGMDENKIKAMPEGITGLKRTQGARELAALYSTADVFVNPTYEDNYPTVNLEAMACGTPVVTYDTGGCKEAIVECVGSMVQQGNVQKLAESIYSWTGRDSLAIMRDCRNHALRMADKNTCFKRYIDLYLN